MWYYVSAYANAGLGNNLVAREHAAQAVNMEPNNLQYRQLLNQLDFSSRRYQNSPFGGGYGAGGSLSLIHIWIFIWRLCRRRRAWERLLNMNGRNSARLG